MRWRRSVFAVSFTSAVAGWACGPGRDAESVKVSGVDAGGVPDAGPLAEPPKSCAGEMQRCMRGQCTRVRERCATTYTFPVDAPRCDPRCEAAANCRVGCEEDASPGCADRCTESLDRDGRACVAKCARDEECVVKCFTSGCSSVVCAFR